jgi:GTPase SAR1 family protein
MYRAMTKLYYRGVHLALIVYDITDKESFDSLSNWLNDVREKQVALKG